MTLDEFESASDDQLRQKASRCFQEYNASQNASRVELLLEAQFFLGEIERQKARHTRKAETWSFWMEFLVIVLILAEIGVTVWEGTEQSKLSAQQTTILTNLQQSSSATVNALRSMQATFDRMNSAIQHQGDLLTQVSLEMFYRDDSKDFVLLNRGNTDVKIYGVQVNQLPRQMLSKPLLVTRGGGRRFRDSNLYRMFEKISIGTKQSFRLQLLLRSDGGKEWIAKVGLTADRTGGPGLYVQVNVVLINPESWSPQG